MTTSLGRPDLLVKELAQRREAGYQVAELERAVEAAVRGGQVRLGALLDRLERPGGRRAERGRRRRAGCGAR